MKTALLLTVILLFTSCTAREQAKQEPVSKEPVKEYAMRGVVTKVDPEHQVATIKHEDIPGFMHAMEMEYGFRDKQDFGKLHVGEKIDATLFTQGDDFWVGRVKPAAPEPSR